MNGRDDDFYVGWADRQPASIHRRVRNCVLGLLATALGLATLLAAAQRPFLPSAFQFFDLRTFRGTVRVEPQPMLDVARPGRDAGSSSWLLVAEGKHGARPLLEDYAGEFVEFRGKLIHEGGTTMIEIAPGTLQRADGRETLPPPRQPLGRFTLAGEIVDSKCFLGVMNPGYGKVHRSCASLCLRGGIPPLFRVPDAGGAHRRLLLLDHQGRQPGLEILDFVGEPVRLTGEVERMGELLLLRMEPGSLEAWH